MATVSYRSNLLEPVSKSTKLRHLKLKSFRKLADLLNIGNSWLEVAMRIKGPDNITDLFSPSDISKLESQWKKGGSPAEAFLQHWSTTGIPSRHPTVGDLLTLLMDAKLYQAADSISKELFQVSIPSANFDVKTEEVLANLKDMQLKHDPVVSDNWKKEVSSNANKVSVLNYPFPSIEEAEIHPTENVVQPTENVVQPTEVSDGLINFNYGYLQEITKNFCNIPVHHGGYKIGEGGFGTVYRAYIRNHWLAIKKLKNEIDKQYFTELELLKRYKHENLLPLFGFSNNGPYSCLVYLYMENGSLQERLACLADSPPISWLKRVSIAFGSAKGINQLHTFGAQPLVHRDIKSANVLLDKNLVAKVGDFGLARIGNSGTSSTAAFTSNVFGTSVYMAPEAFHGEVSIKLDTFSYGVVLMELLTGLPPYDANREEKDLVSYLEEHCKQSENIIDFLDHKSGQWDKNIATSLYGIAICCVERRKKDRPTVEQVLPDIEKLLNAGKKIQL